MGLSRQEYYNGLPFPPPGNLPDPRIEPTSPALAGKIFTTEPPGNRLPVYYKRIYFRNSQVKEEHRLGYVGRGSECPCPPQAHHSSTFGFLPKPHYMGTIDWITGPWWLSSVFSCSPLPEEGWKLSLVTHWLLWWPVPILRWPMCFPKVTSFIQQKTLALLSLQEIPRVLGATCQEEGCWSNIYLLKKN